MEESSGWDQTLFCGAMRQNKRQEAQTETVEVEHEGKTSLFSGETEYWNRLPREVVKSPLEIFITHLDAFCCNQL